MTTDIKELMKRLTATRTQRDLNWNDVTYPINPDGEEAALALEALAGEVETWKTNCKTVSEAWVKTCGESVLLAGEVGRLKETITTATNFNEGLAAERDRLKAAISPFAAIKADDGDDFSTYDDQVVIRCEVTAGDLRKARKALGDAS